jgi:hypothetical protein
MFLSLNIFCYLLSFCLQNNNNNGNNSNNDNYILSDIENADLKSRVEMELRPIIRNLIFEVSSRQPHLIPRVEESYALEVAAHIKKVSFMLISPPIGFKSEPAQTPQGPWRLGPHSSPTLLLGGAPRSKSSLVTTADTQAKTVDGRSKPRPRWKKKVPVADSILPTSVGNAPVRAGDSALSAVRMFLASATAPTEVTVKKKGAPRGPKKTVKNTEIKSEYTTNDASNSTDKENVSTATGTNNSISNAVQENENDDDSALHHPAKAVSLRTAILDAGNGFYATKSRLHAPGTIHSAALLGPLGTAPSTLGPRIRPVPSNPSVLSSEPACPMDIADDSNRNEIARDGGGIGAGGGQESVSGTTTMTGCDDQDKERSGLLVSSLTALANPMADHSIEMDNKAEEEVVNKVESEEERALRLRVVMTPVIARIQAVIAAAKEAYESERIAEAEAAQIGAGAGAGEAEVSVITDLPHVIGAIPCDNNDSSSNRNSNGRSSSSIHGGSAIVSQANSKRGVNSETESKSAEILYKADSELEVQGPTQHTVQGMDVSPLISESLACDHLPTPSLPPSEVGVGDCEGYLRCSGIASDSAVYTDISRVISSVSGSEDAVLLVVRGIVDNIAGDAARIAVRTGDATVKMSGIMGSDNRDMDVDHSDSIINTDMISTGPGSASGSADAGIVLSAWERGGDGLVSAVQDDAPHYSVQSTVALTADIFSPQVEVPAAIPAQLPHTFSLPSSTPLPPTHPLPSSTPAQEPSLGSLTTPHTLPSTATDGCEAFEIGQLDCTAMGGVAEKVESAEMEMEVKMEVEVKAEVEAEDESSRKPVPAVDIVKRIRRPRTQSLPPIAASGVPLLAGWKAPDARTLDHTFQSRPQSPTKAPKGLFHSNITASKIGVKNLDPGSASSAWLDFRRCCLCSSVNSEEESREKEEKEDREEEKAMLKKSQSPLSIKAERNRSKAEKEVEKEVSPVAQDDPVCGRLLPFSDGSHVHANCLRWSTEVIERGGRLINASQARIR